jgi:NAD(P)-dependent dehydrogenase (short-subunit alcohol dehydrogenase family)
MTGNLKDQSVLITGGTDGIGRALLVELVQEGAAVTVVGRSLSKWEETRKVATS